MIVCHCRAVSDRVIEAAALAGARAVAEVTDLCAAGGDCGACYQVIERLVGEVRESDVVLPVPA
ncbi:MAG TPA: [Fe-S]-binding protein [Acidimicrobiaceae bacterium]|nr:hypothetical protein [Acidimicrobiaceae bacterium]HAQ24232.1 [Fe-S]-binding protein [Acidimicrobiaceae bacterium]HCV33622.1 [Fe-S]-binding protein [Acidimicrobiaceae bacterium]|tara:strand:+ start:616 stop:807 length:192 start_codon:yes stop_codon:yes gene_type:complete